MLDTCQTFTRHFARNMLESCQRYAWFLQEACPNFARTMPDMLLTCARNLPGACQKHAANLPDFCQNSARTMQTNYQKYAWLNVRMGIARSRIICLKEGIPCILLGRFLKDRESMQAPFFHNFHVRFFPIFPDLLTSLVSTPLVSARN